MKISAIIWGLVIIVFFGMFTSKCEAQEAVKDTTYFYNEDSTQVVMSITDKELTPEEFLAEIATNALEKENKELKKTIRVAVALAVGYFIIDKIMDRQALNTYKDWSTE